MRGQGGISTHLSSTMGGSIGRLASRWRNGNKKGCSRANHFLAEELFPPVNVIVTPEQLEGGGHDAQVPTGSPALEDSGDGNEAAHTVQEVINALKVLKGASAITGAPGEGVFELFVVPVVNMLEMHPPAHARRLLACAAHPNMPLKHPEGGIVNVALQDPGNLSFNPTSGYLLSKDTASSATPKAVEGRRKVRGVPSKDRAERIFWVGH
ncbi:hypothetical protein BJ322DRAFT_1025739 [Thelephora terrestris]|uniref:Uncharacterized protein n=1 Tax=Thelephora terrestris TaxID=56493 RepID=A0A9P6L056_9AGAM|nr:hypothetical protein BJ322DRAFT_1025739 [Thelephora terrestris]